MRQTDHTGFNPTVEQSKTNIHFVTLRCATICFRLYMVILMEVSNKEIYNGSFC